jgi:hypothetical protein
LKDPDWTPVESLGLRGFDLIQHVPKSSYRDNSMVVVIPSRTPFLHTRFVQTLNSIIWPMNGARAMFFVTGAEVGDAYDSQVSDALVHPQLSKYKYLLTIEDDTLPPPDAVMNLLEAIEAGPFDAVGGLYMTKGEWPQPQCYGSPQEYDRTGVLDFRPRDIMDAVKHGHIVPCLGIAMGCSLYRMQAFRDVPRPWFQTLNGMTPEGPKAMTQDLHWCEKAVRAGKRFAVDCRVRCGHADWNSGVVY